METKKLKVTTNKERVFEIEEGGIVTLEEGEMVIHQEIMESTPTQPPTIKKRTDKVAIVGFAPSSMQLAPFGDESWEIWTLNNIYTAFDLPRWDRWFELHKNFREYPPYHDVRLDATSIVRGDSRPVVKKLDHLEWLKGQSPERPIYFLKEELDIPACRPYPLDEVKKWCESKGYKAYFTNSISYMIAIAIMDGYKSIGIWGVDMAANGEYQHERPSVEYWIGLAQGMGIEVVLPKETELLKARFYGFEDDSDFMKKAQTRYAELMGNHAKAMQQSADAQAAAHYFRGAAEDAQYFITNWSNGG
jgi:hypothetical protein